MKPLQSLTDQGNLLVIDGDSIAYQIGWVHREHQEIEVVQRALDVWFRDLLLMTSAQGYIGILAPPSGVKGFRHKHYLFKPYKGNRRDKEDWIIFWEPHIRQYLLEQYGFLCAPAELETDDVVAILGLSLPHTLSSMGKTVLPWICSPDKDLRQIPGHHLNFTKITPENGVKTDLVSVKEAKFNWCMQMLMGDSTDNIAGIPGMGEKKAKVMLEDVGELMWENTVKLAYQKHFGPYYGNIIYRETHIAVTLMTPDHLLWNEYQMDLVPYFEALRTVDHVKAIY